VVDTATVGGVISGYWAMGNTPTETAPAMTITMEMTLAKMGCSMKNLENISETPFKMTNAGILSSFNLFD
jgi:hypothetical protein